MKWLNRVMVREKEMVIASEIFMILICICYFDAALFKFIPFLFLRTSLIYSEFKLMDWESQSTIHLDSFAEHSFLIFLKFTYQVLINHCSFDIVVEYSGVTLLFEHSPS